VRFAWRLWATYAGGARSCELTGASAHGRASCSRTRRTWQTWRRTTARREVLYDALEHHGKVHCFSRLCAPEAMAEADPVLCLCHPNELAAVPDEIELMARVPVPNESSSTMKYFVFRYRTKPPHWAAQDGWMAGIAGPYPEGGPVSPAAPGTFSRFEAYDSKTPEEHVRTTHELTAAR
jgi:hypothetical protein